ncbi:MAG: serine/threonine-protein phosphatase [Magnetococcales bacterium]|nr:serine/threonine-protein phosphatase [Magnetococcales bacterium]
MPACLVAASIYRTQVDWNRQISATTTEISRLDSAVQLYDIQTEMQKIRGLAQIYAQEKGDRARREVSLQWQALEEKLDQGDASLPEEFRDLGATIRRDFNPDGFTSTPRLLFEIHTQLIARVDDIVKGMAMHAHLLSDADVSIHNLKDLLLRYYPDLGESLGRMRAVVSSILASGEQVVSDRVRFGEVLGNVNRSLERIRRAHQFLRVESPLLQPVLVCFDKGVEPNLMSLLNFSHTLLSEQTIRADPRFFFSLITGTMEQNGTCSRKVYVKLRSNLQTRVGQIRLQRDSTLGLSLAALLIMFGFITDFYRRNRRTLVDLFESRQEVVVAMEKIKSHRDKLAYERDIVERTLEKINRSVPSDHTEASLISLPLERIAGDFLLSATRPDGVRYYLLGDFTGHGLPSALGGPMVADIFHAMTRKSFAPLAILDEINTKLHLKLPRQLYLAAAFLAFDPLTGQVSVWNCGVPDVLHFRHEQFHQAYPSNHIPLGILSEHELASVEQTAKVLETDRIYMFSDGFVEVQNDRGQMFGIDNLRQALGDLLATGQPLPTLLDHVRRFHSEAQGDDLTLLELTF